MEIIGRRRWMGQLEISASRQLQVALGSCGGMLRALTFQAVRKEHYQVRTLSPFRCRARYELIDDDLCAIREVTKLRFPNGQSLGMLQAVPVLKTEHRVLRQQTVANLKASLRGVQMIQAYVSPPIVGVRQTE